MARAREPDDPLAQTTRADIFRTLGALHRPAGTVELAELVGMHPNGVRTHLERLWEAGLVSRDRARQPRGRPRDTWTVAPGARGAAPALSAYADLGRWLARAVAAAPGGRGVEDTGREIGREIGARAGAAGTAEERMRAMLTSLGFAPRPEPRPTDRLAYRLCNCPYREAVRERPEVVCSLHRGITRGLLDEISPGTALDALVPRDPDEAGCLVEIAGPLAAPGRRPATPDDEDA